MSEITWGALGLAAGVILLLVPVAVVSFYDWWDSRPPSKAELEEARRYVLRYAQESDPRVKDHYPHDTRSRRAR